MLVLGLVALFIGIVLLVIGTRLRRASVAGGVLVIVGSAIMAVGVVALGIEGMSRAA